MSEKLDDIRKQIDSLDDRIHDLLMERADLIMSISEEKKRTNTQIVQPAREARMIRRLLGRHRGPLPEATIVRIWRELVGSVSLLQTGLKVSVAQPADTSTPYWDMAKNYFGSVLPMASASSALMAISALREDEASFAVIPWPQDGEDNPWWPFLLHHDGSTIATPKRIVGSLPYGEHVTSHITNDQRALILAKIEFLPSGDDRSFLLLEVDGNVSRARIIDALKSIKLDVLSLYTKSGASTGGDSMHLIEVNDYVATDDARLKKLTDKLEGPATRCTVAGGYPVTPKFDMKLPETLKAVSPEPSPPKKASK